MILVLVSVGVAIECRSLSEDTVSSETDLRLEIATEGRLIEFIHVNIQETSNQNKISGFPSDD